MILCVDIKALKTSNEVQKDVNLEDLLANHTEYYTNTEEALKDNFVPLDFCVSVRSMYSNLVLQNDKDEEKRYYTNLTSIQPFVHNGYDLIMFLASLGLMYSVEYKLGFDKLMTEHSQFSPIGLYNPDPTVINPIIYSHIILSDKGAKELPHYLKDGARFVPISVMNENNKGNIKALLDTIIEVKEKKDE